MAGDAVAALDRNCLPAALHCGAGDDRVGAVGVDFADAFVRQAEGHELADTIVGNVPTHRSGAFGQKFGNTEVGQRIDLQAAQGARDHHPIEAGGAHLFDQFRRQTLLALELFMVLAQDRAHGGGGPHHGLGVDIGR